MGGASTREDALYVEGRQRAVAAQFTQGELHQVAAGEQRVGQNDAKAGDAVEVGVSRALGGALLLCGLNARGQVQQGLQAPAAETENSRPAMREGHWHAFRRSLS